MRLIDRIGILAESVKTNSFFFYIVLENTARYAGLLLAPAEGFGLRPRIFLPYGPKKGVEKANGDQQAK